MQNLPAGVLTAPACAGHFDVELPLNFPYRQGNEKSLGPDSRTAAHCLIHSFPELPESSQRLPSEQLRMVAGLPCAVDEMPLPWRSLLIVLS